VRYGVYHGISANSARLWRCDRARAELGYEPLDDSARYAGDLPDDLADAATAKPQSRLRYLHLS
jgi:hypothetical protein